MTAAMEYLLAQGHRRIACIGGPQRTLTARARLMAWQQSLQTAGIQAPESWLVEGDNLVEEAIGPVFSSCWRVVSTSRRCLPVTMIWPSAPCAPCARQGIQVPAQVSLFGFDDEPAAACLSPALSTVHIPIEQMSELAVHQALRLASGVPVAALPPFCGQLRLRESCQQLQD